MMMMRFMSRELGHSKDQSGTSADWCSSSCDGIQREALCGTTHETCRHIEWFVCNFEHIN